MSDAKTDEHNSRLMDNSKAVFVVNIGHSPSYGIKIITTHSL
jgi:hypothetical protein